MYVPVAGCRTAKGKCHDTTTVLLKGKKPNKYLGSHPRIMVTQIITDLFIVDFSYFVFNLYFIL